MEFASAITRLPRPYDRDRAEDVLAGIGWAVGDLRALLAGTAGCSPYLAGLIGRHEEWLHQALDDDPEVAVDAEIAALQPGGLRETGAALRRAKARVALLSALADLGGVWRLQQVTAALTRLADRSVDVAFRAALAPDLARGKIPGATENDLATSCGLVALAMGKMGASELNYSSDIDLIVLFDDSRYGSDDLAEARAALIKVVRRAMALLSDITDEGYVFRTDLRLRPDPSVTPVVVSISAAERYYEALGRFWERAAFVKARPAAGDVKAGRRFLKAIRPFIWRRHLDFATVEDAHDIRKKIRAHHGHSGAVADTLDGRNLKLGPGGIREIEFFTQTRQLIAGGRDADLRVRGTLAALARLSEKGWVPEAATVQLSADYTRLRELEHRAQMFQDAQTHHLPRTPADWARLADFTGAESVAHLKDELQALFARVHNLTEDFFAPARKSVAPPQMSETAARMVARWRNYPALRSARACEIFNRILPDLLRGFDRAAQPDEAIVQFDGFLKGQPSGVQLFSLFDANPQLIELMVDISSTAPALARYLADNPGVLDAVIGGDFFAPLPPVAELQADLSARLDNPDLDFERQLDTARYWQKDRHFRVGVHHLRGLIGPVEAAEEYSNLAEAVLAALWYSVSREFAKKYGSVPGRGAVVVGMGSLGARALTARSDLDLIVIYDADPEVESDGRKPLPARTYYARMTKALITALSAQTAAGTLYQVDMRLRPSGRQGPAATAWSGFRNYQRVEARTWEHLALTRARVVAGDDALAADVDRFRGDLLAAPREPGTVLGDLADMRRRLADAKPQDGAWDTTNGPGGLQDIELFAQAAALLSASSDRSTPAQIGLCDRLAGPDAGATLAEAHRVFSALRGVARLLTWDAFDPAAVGQGGRAILLRDTGAESLEALEISLAAHRAKALAVIEKGMSG